MWTRSFPQGVATSHPKSFARSKWLLVLFLFFFFFFLFLFLFLFFFFFFFIQRASSVRSAGTACCAQRTSVMVCNNISFAGARGARHFPIAIAGRPRGCGGVLRGGPRLLPERPLGVRRECSI